MGSSLNMQVAIGLLLLPFAALANIHPDGLSIFPDSQTKHCMRAGHRTFGGKNHEFSSSWLLPYVYICTAFPSELYQRHLLNVPELGAAATAGGAASSISPSFEQTRFKKRLFVDVGGEQSGSELYTRGRTSRPRLQRYTSCSSHRLGRYAPALRILHGRNYQKLTRAVMEPLLQSPPPLFAKQISKKRYVECIVRASACLLERMLCCCCLFTSRGPPVCYSL
jgi:hypothetical protein